MASGQEKPFEIKNQGLYSSVSEHEVVLKHYPDIQIVTTVFLINKVNNMVMGLHTHTITMQNMKYCGRIQQDNNISY